MHRIDDPTAVPTLPAPRPQGTPGYFTGGSPGSSGFAATVVRYEFMNALQEELAAIVAAAGLTLDKTNNGQVLAALRQMVRFKLTADTVFYISPSGNDSNDGLTAGTAFLTGQAAWNKAMTIDLNDHNLILQFAHGTYTNPINCAGRPLGLGPANNITLLGDVTQPTQVIFSTTNANCVIASAGAALAVSGLTLHATGTPSGQGAGAIGTGLLAVGGTIYIGNQVIFGQCDYSHMESFGPGSVISSSGDPYQITGSASMHMNVAAGAYLGNVNSAVAITGTPNFSNCFAAAQGSSVLDAYGVAYSGAATGVRYRVGTNSTIITYGAAATYFPGNAAGIVDSATYGVIY
jgi:hypothetical protein